MNNLTPTHKGIIALISFLLLGFVLWLVIKKPKNVQTFTPQQGVQDDTPIPAPNPTGEVDTTQGVFPLKRGSTGREVEQLQLFLISKGEGITADGKFGPKTEIALQNALQVKEVSRNLFRQNQIGGFATKLFKPDMTQNKFAQAYKGKEIFGKTIV